VGHLNRTRGGRGFRTRHLGINQVEVEQDGKGWLSYQSLAEAGRIAREK